MSGGGAASLDPRTPVLVGVGIAHEAAPSTELMAMAAEAAIADAAAPALAAAVDRIAVPQGTWTTPDPGRLVAHRLGASGARTHLFELGIPQQSLINDTLAAIVAGTAGVALVVGGESKRWERQTVRAGEETAPTDPPDAAPNEVHRRMGPLLEPVEVAHRLWEPVQQYAMIENALRTADGCTIAEHRAAISALWARYNAVATTNPDAAFGEPRDAVAIDTPGASNRPLAFPYNKWHASQWTVDQAAGLLFCSVEQARRFGIDPDRWIFPLVGLESSHALSLLARAAPHRWPAMEVLGTSAALRIRRPLAEVETIEVYSCFPAAVRVQQDALGLGRAGTPTVTGGMAFAGGPFNNFVLQSTAAVVHRLREEPGTLGMVTTVSGLLTKPGIGIWSARPDGDPPLLADLAYEAEAATGAVSVVESLEGYRGPATVATYTVTYDGQEPVRTLALCDTPDRRRCVAVREDGALAAWATAHELVGAEVEIAAGSFDRR